MGFREAPRTERPLGKTPFASMGGKWRWLCVSQGESYFPLGDVKGGLRWGGGPILEVAVVGSACA